MIKVIWHFEKYYSDESFHQLFSESNDVIKEGYNVIARDWAQVDSMDDMNLTFTLEDYSDENRSLLLKTT